MLRRYLLAGLLFQCIPFVHGNAAQAEPKLVLWITVDQLRGDQPLRFEKRFADGGFRYLMDNGVLYTNAHYQHSTTFTAVGHATLFTGASPSEHGLAGNDWYSVSRKDRVYCVQDEQYHLLGKEPVPYEGTSPRNLNSSTVGDELILASGGQSRVFSVSIKDRGAILPGGHMGKAFWYASSSGKFVTSNYYYKEYPKWVSNWNNADHAGRYEDKQWTLLSKKETYQFINQDDRPFEKSYKQLGRTFPHPLKHDDKKDFFSALRYTPMGDELTLDFARELIKNEKLGTRGTTDMLAVSLSATDYIGHAFGPNSLEAEDNMLRLDAYLAAFLQFVDDQIGLKDTLIVLSSDHGVDETPEFTHATIHGITPLSADFVPRTASDRLLQRMMKNGAPILCCSAGRHDTQKLIADANKALRDKLNVDTDLIAAFWNPSFYLHLDALKQAKVSVKVAEDALANHLSFVNGIAFALTRTDLLQGKVPKGAITVKMQAAFHASRTGHVMIVQNRSWYLYPKTHAFSAMHGSPYSYDTFVPIIIAGPGIKASRISRAVAPKDIAPTVAAYLKLKPPSASSGKVLGEVVNPD